MSLRIDVDRVEAVLVAGEWYQVADESFDIDAYEFLHEEVLLYSGGSGFMCKAYKAHELPEDAAVIFGPVSAIQAVRYSR